MAIASCGLIGSQNSTRSKSRSRRKHSIDVKLPYNEKVESIISSGVSFSEVLKEDIFKADVKLADKKKSIAELCDEKLGITPAIKGATLDDKIANLIDFFAKQYGDEKIGISTGGYERMVFDLKADVKDAEKIVREKFQLQEDDVMHGEFLTDYNIMPRDVLELFSTEALTALCEAKEIKTRGNIIENILAAYKDTEDMLVENYEAIGFRDINTLKENGYNKFSSISRQVKAYKNLLERNSYQVDRIFIVAPDFSEDFVADCGDEFSLPITLLKASSLAAIYNTVKTTGTERFTLPMLTRDILCQEDRIIRALNK